MENWVRILEGKSKRRLNNCVLLPKRRGNSKRKKKTKNFFVSERSQNSFSIKARNSFPRDSLLDLNRMDFDADIFDWLASGKFQQEFLPSSSSASQTKSDEPNVKRVRFADNLVQAKPNKVNTLSSSSNSMSSEKEKNEIPKLEQNISYANDSTDTTFAICTICLSTPSNEIGQYDCCKHSFCFECLKTWTKTKDTCPVCRGKAKTLCKINAETGKTLLKTELKVPPDKCRCFITPRLPVTSPDIPIHLPNRRTGYISASPLRASAVQDTFFSGMILDQRRTVNNSDLIHFLEGIDFI